MLIISVFSIPPSVISIYFNKLFCRPTSIAITLSIFLKILSFSSGLINLFSSAISKQPMHSYAERIEYTRNFEILFVNNCRLLLQCLRRLNHRPDSSATRAKTFPLLEIASLIANLACQQQSLLVHFQLSKSMHLSPKKHVTI